MKYLLSLIIHLISLDLCAQTSLTVNVTNINKIQGDLVVAIYNSKTDFLKQGSETRKLVKAISSRSETFQFTGLPAGQYSVAVCHDKNADGKCNTNFLGLPKEGYGFSRNFHPRFSAPGFNDTRITLTRDTTLQIKLLY